MFRIFFSFYFFYIKESLLREHDMNIYWNELNNRIRFESFANGMGEYVPLVGLIKD